MKKTQATILSFGPYKEIRIVYSNPDDPKNLMILRVTEEKLQPTTFANKVKSDTGLEAVNIPGFLYWQDDGLFYTLAGVPFEDKEKIFNSIK